MVTNVNLKFNGITYRVLCSKVIVGGTKGIDVKPYANIAGPVEGQTLSFENLTISLQGVHYVSDEGTLTWGSLLDMYKHVYDNVGTGVNGPLVLNVTYGKNTSLKGLNNSTDIKVLVKSFSLPIDVGDSKDGYMPVGSITLVETA